MKNGRVVVVAAHLTGLAVDISEDDARTLARGLIEMLGDPPSRG